MSQEWRNSYPTHRYRIFFVDDQLYTLDTVRDVLEDAGYMVFTAETREEAEQVLSKTHVHLGIFDINLKEDEGFPDDSESHNRDGLELATSLEFPPIRMMYTVYDNRHLIINALRSSTVVDFIVKDEDKPADLLAKVEEALQSNLRINYNLHIHWETGSFMELAQKIAPNLPIEELVHRVFELEDLFRMQFYAIQDRAMFTQISLDILPIDKLKRQWLKVTAYTEQDNRYEYLLLCGEREQLIQEYQNFEKAQGANNQYRIAPPVETVHYRINAYEVFNNSLRELGSLSQHYRRGDFEMLTLALNTLPDARFKRPSQQATTLEEGNLYQIASGRPLAIGDKQIDRLYDIVERIADEWRHYVNDSKLEVQPQAIRYNIGDAETYPNPVYHLETISRLIVQRNVGLVHGDLRLNSAFAHESNGDLYLVDYGDNRIASVLHDFVTLERSVHLLELSRAELEKHETLAYVLSALDEEDTYQKLPPTLHNAVHLIHAIRRKALEVSGNSLDDYLQDLYIDFMNYLLSYPERPHAGYQTVRQYSHCLMFAAQICSELVETHAIAASTNGSQDGIWLDAAHNRVRVLGQFFRLTPHQFGIFQHLYDNLGEECSYTDIIRYGLHEMPLDDIENDKPRIHTAVSRLRNRVEEFGFTIEAWRNGYYMVKKE